MRARRSVWAALLAAGLLGSSPAWGVSDGNYDPKQQGCTGKAMDSDQEDRVEKDCRTVMLKLTDGTHTYFSVSVPQTADGETQDRAIVCIALRQQNHCAEVGRGGFKVLPVTKTNSAKPGQGLHLYLGADDNLNGGEHDGSNYVNNGPSDGGAVRVNVVPWKASEWAEHIIARDRQYLLTHPAPMANAGMGACADGICFAVQTQRRIAYAGGDKTKGQSASNYEGKEWDPESCSGPSDEAEDCGGEDMGEWHADNGYAFTEPGIQVYEDPDPQGSPLGPYPLPAIYIGTCGVIVGGGPVQAPPSPFTNSAGQFVVETGC